MPRVLITGANRGIGLEFARQYAADGWQVIACCRKPGEADALKKVKGEVSIEALDVANDDQIAKLAGRLKGQAIDLLINNAGVYGPQRGTDAAAWLEVFRVNTIAPFRLAEALTPHVARSKHKLIVGITSLMGSLASASGSDAAIYRSSKAALNMVMKCLSNGLKAKGITVAVYHPGWVRTDMGGPSGQVSVEESAEGLIKVIDGLTMDHTGGFLDYRGHALPW